MALRALIRAATYRDSVALMGLQGRLSGLPGVADAGVLMGTPANLDLLRHAGLWRAELESAGADDLVVVVAGEEEAALDAAVGLADRWLSAAPAPAGARPAAGTRVPRTLEAALRADPDANLALISLPGRYAAEEARRALERGLHVFLFSDNVPLEEEVELKRLAGERGLLCMGPDCGTALVDGCALGFANALPRGPVGVVGASGTGIQELACALEREGIGVSHAVGLGGRDLSAEVAGRGALAALGRLEADAGTEVIAVVSKPPAPEVAAAVRAACHKPAVFCLLGEGRTLAAAAREVASLVERPRRGASLRGRVRGLYGGGTLAAEAAQVLRAWLEEPVGGELDGPGHSVVDLGDDRFTQGRLHPMIDYTLRCQLARRALADPGTGCLLLDVVLGHGAHPDPASALAPCLEGARVPIVVALCGTEGDPQVRSAQRLRLERAGARVLPSNAAAARLAARLVRGLEGGERPPLLGRPLRAVTLGLETFAFSLARQGVPALQVDWRPPAGGDPELYELLLRLR